MATGVHRVAGARLVDCEWNSAVHINCKLRNVTAPDAQRLIHRFRAKKKIRAAHAKEKQQIQKRATTRIALTCLV
jgi:hypothetical protein